MGKSKRATIAVAAIAVLLAGSFAHAQQSAAPTPKQNCALNRLVTLDLTPAPDGTLLVPVAIQGQVLHFRLNAFGQGWISEKTANALKLQAPPETFDSDPSLRSTVIAPTLSLMGRTQRVDVSSVILPTRDTDDDVDGALGAEVLLSFDLDFDFAANQLNLFSPDHCPGKVVYWANDYAEIPMLPAERISQTFHSGKPVVEFSPEQSFTDTFKGTLEGVEVFMAFNTELTRSRLPLELGISLFKIERPPGTGWASPRVTTSPKVWLQHKFSNLAFSGLTLRSVDVDLWDDESLVTKRNTIEIGLRKLDLGLDVLRQLHLYVASDEQKYYFTAASAHK